MTERQTATLLSTTSSTCIDSKALLRSVLTLTRSAIVSTLNYTYTRPYPGLSIRSGRGGVGAATTYPTSAFITHLVYLRGCLVEVDVQQLTVRIYLSLMLRSTTLTSETDTAGDGRKVC
jgi:hypothetical protein